MAPHHLSNLDRSLPESQAVSRIARQYLNRPSDLLFVLARTLNRAGVGGDAQWDRQRNHS